MKSKQWYDQRGQRLVLGRELGTGGEGAVFAIDGMPTAVAKVYHKPPPPDKARKLQLMSSLAERQILEIAAWPQATLHATPGSPVQGLVMPKVQSGSEIHELYSPAHRRSRFPEADWRFLMRTARNCAGAFGRLHKYGIVIGDVNQGNLFVTKQAMISLIDCDSFQFQCNGELYRCTVGVPHYTPPELQKSRLSEVVRNTNHDCFGLAVLIFHLLFMGRHPYSGTFLGAGDLPLEKAISEHRFAYGLRAAQFQVSAPPHTMRLDEIHPLLRSCFERAFAPDAGNGKPRPSALEWYTALTKAEGEIRQCADESSHYYWGNQCVWCRIADGGGPDFFLAVVNATSTPRPSFNVRDAWSSIEAVERPETSYRSRPRPPQRSYPPRPLPFDPQGTTFLQRVTGWVSIGFGSLALAGVALPVVGIMGILGLLLFGSWWGLLRARDPMRRERAARRSNVRDVERKLARARSELAAACQRAKAQFDKVYLELRELRGHWENSDYDRQKELNDLQQTAAEQQRKEYLDQRFISSARIPKIGEGRKATLASYGIETAADVSWQTIERIPGFGPALCESIIAWRNQCAASFRFDPRRGVPPLMVQQLEAKYAKLRREIEKQLRFGPQLLRSVVQEGHREVGQYEEAVIRAEVLLQEALADLRVAKGK